MNENIKTYCESIITEATVLNNILNKQIIPSLLKYLTSVLQTQKLCEENELNALYLDEICMDINYRVETLYDYSKKLQSVLQSAISAEIDKKPIICRDKLLPLFTEIRTLFDEIEHKMPSEFKPFPTYDDILFD